MNAVDSIMAAGAEEERTPVTLYAAGMLVLCVLVGATEGYDVQAMALAAPLVRAAWHLGFDQIGMLLAVSAIGLVIGSFLLSPLGDALGRRPAILLGLLIAGLGTGGSAFVPDLGPMIVARLVAGVGLGLALPNVLAVAMELMPRRAHAFAVVLVSCGYPLGAAIGAATASMLIPTHGWAAVFLVGGAGSAIALLLSALLLPESPSFLARRPAREAELARLLARLGRRIPPATLQQKVEQVEGTRERIAALFAPERRRATSLLWLISLGNVALVYFFFSWLPSLITASGFAPEEALRATSLFSVSGAIGALLMVFLLPRLGALRVLVAAYVAAIVVTVLFARPEAGVSFHLIIAVAGAAIIGSQFCLSAIIAQYYPGAIRATASGFAAGIGRAGSILTPIIAGALIGVLGGGQRAFLIALAPAGIALVAAVWLELGGDLRRPRS